MGGGPLFFAEVAPRTDHLTLAGRRDVGEKTMASLFMSEGFGLISANPALSGLWEGHPMSQVWRAGSKFLFLISAQR